MAIRHMWQVADGLYSAAIKDLSKLVWYFLMYCCSNLDHRNSSFIWLPPWLQHCKFTNFSAHENNLANKKELLKVTKNQLKRPAQNLYYFQSPSDPCPVPEHDRLIMYGSKLLGVPRMRQLRVRNDSCSVPTNFKNLIKVKKAGVDPTKLCFFI